MTTMKEREYFAVPDPDSGTMTYWYRDQRGQLQPWPRKPRPRYGPRLSKEQDTQYRAMDYDEGRAFILNWMHTVTQPWHAKIRAEIERDPERAHARFAVFAIRCCICGRVLTDPTSKVVGIGPECRAGLPDGFVNAIAEQVRQIHAESERAPEDSA